MLRILLKENFKSTVLAKNIAQENVAVEGVNAGE